MDDPDLPTPDLPTPDPRNLPEDLSTLLPPVEKEEEDGEAPPMSLMALSLRVQPFVKATG